MRLPSLVADDLDDPIESFTSAVAFARQALSERLPADRDILVVAVPAALDSPERALRILPREMGFLWRSPHGTQIAGGGCVLRIDASGPNRTEQLRSQMDAFFGRVCLRVSRGISSPPALFGGLSFVPDVPPFEPWEEFGSGTFSLPRWAYLRTRTEAQLRLAVTRAELEKPAVVEGLLDELQATLVAFDTDTATSLIERYDIPRSAVYTISAPEWRTYLAAVKDAIASKAFDKLVAARRCVVDLPKPLDDTGFMARLFAAYPDCTHFAFRRGDSTFMGATPETLFVKRGLEITTHALAGTRRVEDDPNFDSTPDMAKLQKSRKDQVEHALVVKKICDELKPLAKSLRYPRAPEARRVRNLVHLQTPISATLHEGVNAFELIETLHPTPAVGGFPTKEAAIWLRENEPLERGWYTGTVGWVDADGNAEFGVAIRCGVLTPKRAHIFAGAGIVRESDPDSEYKETGAKLHPILRALGVVI